MKTQPVLMTDDLNLLRPNEAEQSRLDELRPRYSAAELVEAATRMRVGERRRLLWQRRTAAALLSRTGLRDLAVYRPAELEETAHRIRVMDREPVYEPGTRFVVPELDSVWMTPTFPELAGRTGVVIRVIGPVIVPPSMVENLHLVRFDNPTHPTPGPAPRPDGCLTLSHTWMSALPLAQGTAPHEVERDQ